MTSPDTLLIDDEVISDTKNVANSFNRYFSSVANKLQSKIIPPKEDFSKYLKNRSTNSFFISPVTKEEVKDIIDNISAKKATGPHSLPSFLLNEINDSISQPLADLVNMSFTQGNYIEALKI